ncbi:zinc finger protein 518A [Labrus mixtus]|uniref:zinc finger protein 518A n=1 Tax=Labrus mixtus TaxID=508554 RepID=UPI0029C00CA5|nr:zinc finger protein 518A [Labrus mixtus]
MSATDLPEERLHHTSRRRVSARLLQTRRALKLPDFCRSVTMEEEPAFPPDSARGNVSVPEDEKDKVKDFVFKHFREVTDESLFSTVEESSVKDYGCPTKRDRQPVNKASGKVQQGAVFSGKILSFECSVCKDGSTYSPNDLLKHFRAAHQHALPTYPCDLCGFSTNEFPALQRHRIEHRNTLVTCELCNDDVQYSLLLLTRHYIMCHSVNGQFHCDWCDFTTVDAGTFVQHIHHHNESPWKCSKCRHISLNEDEHQKHLKAHSGTFPFTCQVCGYGAARNEYLQKHTAAVHRLEAERRSLWKSAEESLFPTNASTALKVMVKKSESQETQRTSKVNSATSNQNGRLIKPEKSLEGSLVDGAVAIRDNKQWNKGSSTTEQALMLQECDTAASDSAAHTSPNGLTVLMVKNKISLPPNCTTKVMGFKMVEGKKHLVLKVIPAAKQDLSNQNGSLGEDVTSAPNPVSDQNLVIVENGEGSHSKSSKSHCSAVSPRSGSFVQTDQDEIMTVKVKIEEEETSVSSLDCTPNRDDVGEQSLSRTCADASDPTTDDSDHSQPNQTTSSETNMSHNSLCEESNGSEVWKTLRMCSGKVTDLSTLLTVSKKNILSKQVTKQSVENCGAAEESTDRLHENLHGNSLHTVDYDAQCPRGTTEYSNIPPKDRTEIKNKNCRPISKNFSTNPALLSDSAPPSSGDRRESTTGSENCTKNSSPNQEVFSFHNYSKESFSSSPNTYQNSDHTSRHSADRRGFHEPSRFSLSLSESPELSESVSGEDSSVEVDEGAMNSDHEVSECIVGDPPSEDEHPESVLRDFNIIKIEEDSVPISKPPAETKTQSNSLGTFVEEHSDAIITQQLNKERVASSCAGKDSLKPTKTTLRILQLPEGKQPVLLRTSDNQVKTGPGFKLITNSSNPQINVSYMSSGLERSGNKSGLTPSPNNRVVAVSVPKTETPDKGTALLSAVQSGVSKSSNHYFINSPGFKGPVLLSSTPQNTPTDKCTKTQPTCFLLQRSVPFVQSPSTPVLRLANTQLPLNSRPVLAMPVNSTDKPGAPHAGRQAFLLRYISPPKSGRTLNNHDAKAGTPCGQTNESSGNKVFFKIVTPTGSLLTSGAPASSSQPFFLSTRPQTQCFLVSSNKSATNASNAVKKMISVQNTAQRDLKESIVCPGQLKAKVPPSEAEKPILAPRPIRPPSLRKRRRKALFDELPETVHKSRRLSHKTGTEKETPVLWKPVAKDTARTLRLSPFSGLQLVRCPRRYQPVVVLNHPDADIPEVANIMRVVNRHKGAVSKVSLSQQTVQALSELAAQDNCGSSHDPTPQPVRSSVRERFLLKMKLRKKSRKKYEVVDTLSGCRQESVVFNCWFCGRLFNNQEDWIGHGQRHLMEATRDWNKLF